MFYNYRELQEALHKMLVNGHRLESLVEKENGDITVQIVNQNGSTWQYLYIHLPPEEAKYFQ